MALLFLLLLVLALAVARAVLGMIAVLSALGILAIAFAVSLAFLPWPVALAGWLVLGGTAVRASRREMERAIRDRMDARRRIREFEGRADDSSLPFETRARLRRQAFDLRCELDDWEGFP